MEQVIDKVLAALPSGLATTNQDVIEKYLTDFRGKYRGATRAVLRPKSTKDVALCVRLCAQHGVPLVPQGGNTSYCGAATPDASGAQLILSFERLNAMREIDPANRSITVDSGVILSTLQDIAADNDLMCPIALGSQQSCQIGGNISTNAGGVNVLRYGMARDLVLGLEVVLPDGRILDTLSPLRKNNTGYNTDQLFIGAEGTLGLITGVSLKLERKPRQLLTALLVISDSNAILVYLARKYAPTYIPSDPVGEAEVQKFLTLAAGELAFGPAAARLINVFKAPLDIEFTHATAAKVLGKLEAHMEGRDFLVGAAPTIADVAIYSYTAHAPEGDVSLEAYPNVRRLLSNIEALDHFVPMPVTPVGLSAA